MCSLSTYLLLPKSSHNSMSSDCRILRTISVYNTRIKAEISQIPFKISQVADQTKHLNLPIFQHPKTTCKSRLRHSVRCLLRREINLFLNNKLMKDLPLLLLDQAVLIKFRTKYVGLVNIKGLRNQRNQQVPKPINDHPS